MRRKKWKTPTAVTAFQSTHPLRGATQTTGIKGRQTQYFNPRTPCGVRHLYQVQSYSDRRFQSTHPLRGATNDFNSSCILVYISIHAPLAGCDRRTPVDGYGHRDFNPRTPCGVRQVQNKKSRNQTNFNPRTPCGVRPKQITNRKSTKKFQSTHPLRGATTARSCARMQAIISIHAPLAGCDSYVLARSRPPGHFNPRTPCGVRLIFASTQANVP